jgi:hypothetical protein
MKVRRVKVILLLGAVMPLAGCLLTMGAPLARRIEPDSWVIEAGGGVLAGDAGAQGLAWAYAGRAIGSHWEVGALGWAYGLGTEVVGALALPVRWDPVPYERQLHVILGAGPLVFFADGAGMSALAEVALAWHPRPSFDLWLSASMPVPYYQLFTVAAGTRWHPARRLALGVSAQYTNLAGFAADLSVGTTLGGGTR